MNQPPLSRSILAAFSGVLLVSAMVSGCAEFDLRRGIPWGPGKDGKFEAPMQVVPFWSTAVQNKDDQQGGLRGIGGRLYFYGKNPNKPVKVSGTLVIYAFDEHTRDPKNVVPDRKYVFTAEQFKNKYGKSELGHSYSIWLPWDAVGGPEKEISLIARFTSELGEMVSSEQTKIRLPGIPGDEPPVSSVVMSKTTSQGAPANAVASPAALNALASQFAVQQAALHQPVEATPSDGNSNAVVQAAATSSVMVPPNAAAPAPAIDAVEFGQKRMSTTTITLPQSPPTRPMQNMNYPGAGSVINQAPGTAIDANARTPLQAALTAARTNQRAGIGNGQQAMHVPQNIGVQNTPIAGFPAVQGPGSAIQNFPGQLASGQISPGVRSESGTPRVLGAPIARLESARDQWPPSPGGLQYAPPSQQ